MKYSIALVEYLNTLPFSEGLKQATQEEHFEVHRVTPAKCAQLFADGQADISLCPVGALSDMPAHEIRGSYCIGADGEVDTVVLLSQVPLEQIKSVRLDDHSRTSNLLLQVLAERYWHKEWDYYMSHDTALSETCLMIGDKVFKHRDTFAYRYDLAAAWKALTGLPMVFAVWIARPGIPDAVIQQLDEAFRFGMEWVTSGKAGLEEWEKAYLMHRISYPLDEGKLKAMDLYLDWSSELATVDVTR